MTMNFNYLVMEPLLRMDDLNLISKFEEYYDFGSHKDDDLKARIKEKMIELDAFARIICMIMS